MKNRDGYPMSQFIGVGQVRLLRHRDEQAVERLVVEGVVTPELADSVALALRIWGADPTKFWRPLHSLEAETEAPE